MDNAVKPGLSANWIKDVFVGTKKRVYIRIVVELAWRGALYATSVNMAPYFPIRRLHIPADKLSSYSYPHLPQTIHITTLLKINGGVVAFLVLLSGILSFFEKTENKILNTVKGMFQAFLCISGSAVLGFFSCETPKHFFQTPRPHYLMKCYGQAALELKGAKLLAWDNPKCTESKLTDARQSFPSGHSSSVFSIWTVLILYLHFIVAPRVRQYVGSLNLIIEALLFGFPIWVAASRVFDYYHHPIDIFAGSLIGIIAAYFSFKFYYDKPQQKYQPLPQYPQTGP